MKKDLLVGTVFLLSVLGMAGMTLTIGNLDFLNPPTRMNVYFDNVTGLSEGDQVRVRGVVVGQVGEIHAPDEDLVLVELKMEKNYPVTAGSSFRVKPASALGGSFVDFKPGVGTLLTPDEMKQVPGTGTEDAFAMLGELVQEVRTSPGLIHKLIYDETFANRFERISVDIEEIAAKINHGTGPISIALNDEDIAASFRRVPDILTDVSEITASINNAEGALGKFIKEEDGARVVQKVFDDIEAEKGILGRVISNESFANRFESAIGNISEVFHSISQGEGAVARLLNDPEIAADLGATMASLSSVSEKMDRGSGTIARLLNEGELMDEASNTLILLRDVTEDAREQAPVNAFLNAIFGFF